MGKKLGIAAFILSIIFAILCIITIVQAPEIGSEVYELVTTDKELALEKMDEYLDNASTLYKVADTASTFVGIGGFILSIVSLVKMSKAKEKGKVFPVLAIVIMVVFFFISTFAIGDFGEAFEAGLNAGAEMKQK